MTYAHGVTISEQATSIVPATEVEAGLPVVVGCAPVHFLDETGPVNTPRLIYSYADAVAAFGYSSDFESYNLCEFMYAAFGDDAARQTALGGRRARHDGSVITSYSIHYTKLYELSGSNTLINTTGAMENSANAAYMNSHRLYDSKSDEYPNAATVITSYSIHYTKLYDFAAVRLLLFFALWSTTPPADSPGAPGRHPGRQVV